MRAHRISQRRVDRSAGDRLVGGNRPTLRQRGVAMALDDRARGGDQRLAGQNAVDAREDGPSSGRELHLQQFGERPRIGVAAREAPGQQGLRLRGEGKTAASQLGVVERLDAEGVARQDQPPGLRIMQRDRPHPTQRRREAGAVAAVEVQRRFAIRPGREGCAGQRRAQIGIIVDLAIGDQGGPARLAQRLIAGLEIDDREPVMRHRNRVLAVAAHAVGAAMREGRAHRRDRALRHRFRRRRHDPRNAAHQDRPAIAEKKSR